MNGVKIQRVATRLLAALSLAGGMVTLEAATGADATGADAARRPKPPPCTGSAIAVTASPTDGAAGHSSFVILMRNASRATCTLRGFPGLDALGTRGQVLVHAVRTGGPVTTVTLAPGQFASARSIWLNFNHVTSGPCRMSRSIATTPPNTTKTVRLAVPVSVCELTIHPTVAGTSGWNAFAGGQYWWIAGSRVIAVQQGAHWHKAATDLAKFPGAYTAQIAELNYLIALPLTGLTPAQIATAKADVADLNSFFRTPGLYG